MIYLRPKQEYIDRHDKITVEDCRRRESFHKNYQVPGEKAELKIAMGKVASKVALYFDIFFSTLDWWERKTKTVEKWMGDDMRKDKLLETAKAPEGIRCLKCWTPLTSNSKDLHDWSDKGDRVVFFYKCPTGCLPHRAFFDDGEEYMAKRDLCPKCQIDLVRTHKREGKKITDTDTCTKCGYTNSFEYEFGKHEGKTDYDFEKDRVRFCLTDEAGRKAQQERLRMDQFAKTADKLKKMDEQKEEYEAMAKIQKLNVLDLEKLLAPAFEKAGYLRLRFGTPEIGKDFFLPFTAYDSKSERMDLASTHDLARIIKKCLADTNWRLMSDGIHYRLGFLSGRLRAYEREEDLLELVKLKQKHSLR